MAMLLLLFAAVGKRNCHLFEPDKTEVEQSQEIEIIGTKRIEEIVKFYQSADAFTIVSKADLNQLIQEQMFYQEELSDSIFERIYEISFKEDCQISRDELRYLRVLHRGFDGETHIGELICNEALADDLLDIFEELYNQDYPIERMVLIDNYAADDEQSMSDNNTSCFNFRKVSGTAHLSKHAVGRAIDINPLYNPYVRTRDGQTCIEPTNAAAYADRSKDFSYKIDKEDLCCQLFLAHGFEWGGDWYSSKDYQHFQKSE